MDVHRESISIAVMNSAGKIVLECVVETKASIILQFIDGLRGDLHVTFLRRNLGRLVVRPAEAARHEIGGVRSVTRWSPRPKTSTQRCCKLTMRRMESVA
jgi:hypothetical protein